MGRDEQDRLYLVTCEIPKPENRIDISLHPGPEALREIIRVVDLLASQTGPNAPPGFEAAFAAGERWADSVAIALVLYAWHLDLSLFPPDDVFSYPLGEGRDYGHAWGYDPFVTPALRRLAVIVRGFFTRWNIPYLPGEESRSPAVIIPPRYTRWPQASITTVEPAEHEALLWISRTLKQGLNDALDAIDSGPSSGSASGSPAEGETAPASADRWEDAFETSMRTLAEAMGKGNGYTDFIKRQAGKNVLTYRVITHDSRGRILRCKFLLEPPEYHREMKQECERIDRSKRKRRLDRGPRRPPVA
jgi:hypothetical protein